MYFISTFESCNGAELPDVFSVEAIAFYDTLEEAKNALQKGIQTMSINQGKNTYATIERYSKGIRNKAECEWWFEWDDEKLVYHEIERPEIADIYYNFLWHWWA